MAFSLARAWFGGKPELLSSIRARERERECVCVCVCVVLEREREQRPREVWLLETGAYRGAAVLFGNRNALL